MEGLQAEIEKLLDVMTVILLQLSEVENYDANDVKLILDKSKIEVTSIQQSIIEIYRQENTFNDDINSYPQNFEENCDDLIKEEDIISTVKSEIIQDSDNTNDTSHDAYYNSDEIKQDDCNAQELAPEEEDSFYENAHKEDNFSDSAEEKSAIKISIRKITNNNQNRKFINYNEAKYDKAIEDFKSGKFESAYAAAKKHKVNKKTKKRFEIDSGFENIISNKSLYHLNRKCNQCDFIVTSKSKFIKHMEIVHSTAVYNAGFLKDWSQHLVQCKQCDFSYQHASYRHVSYQLNNHIQMMHAETVLDEEEKESDEYKTTRKCSRCDFIAHSISELVYHCKEEHSH